MEIQPIQILLQVINFGLVLFVLVKFLYHPIAKVLEERSEKIKEGLDAAEKNIAEKDKLEKSVKADIAKARKDAEKIIDEAKKAALVEAQGIIAKAKEQAKKSAENEKTAIIASLEEDKASARRDLVKMVTAAVSKVMTDGLTEADHKRIINSQIAAIEKIAGK